MSAQSKILTLDHNQRNLELLEQFLGKEGYTTIPVSTLVAVEEILENTEGIGIALVDISGFDRRIWEYCERLANQGVPLLVISSQQVVGIQQESLSHGAQGVLFKPLVVKELSSVIRSLIRGDPDE
jgi:DNA-binding response OmpR family regulator